MQEINREFDRITVETSREVNRLSGEAFDLRQKVRVLQERLKAWTQSQLPGVRYWEQPHYHALSDEISNLGKREADLSTKISRLRSEAARKQLDFLSVPKKEQATFTANVAIKKKGVAEPAREGVSLFRAMVPKKYLPPNRYNDGTLIGEKTVTVRHTKSRGFYRANEAYTSGAGAHARETVVHELGHWLEEKSDEVRRAAEEFLYNRTKGNAVTKFGGNYGPDEIYRPDKFYHDYVGKMYGEVTNFDSPDGWGPGGKFRPKWRYRATEIFSMGLEAMARNPAKFLQDDPGHFELILKLIYGEL